MDWENVGIDLIQAVVPVLTVVFVFLARKVAPILPRFTLPILALVGGTVIDYVLGLASGGTFTPVVGALLGASGVWLREFFNTIKVHGIAG